VSEPASVAPFSLKDAPALIERLLPVQKLSAEAYKEQMANTGKTLTAIGSFWKGRKPLILNKACVLGCLLPATDNPAGDLEIFELLMGMDDESFAARWKRHPKPKEILGALAIPRIEDYFTVEPSGSLSVSAPIDWESPNYGKVKVAWRADINERVRRQFEARMLPDVSYRERVALARRPEEVGDSVHDHVWDAVNDHLGTKARTFPELVEQLGVMRFGHRPRVADPFCGSGQIPFEAARLGCDVYASDLNPVACMLTWGNFHLVGASSQRRQITEKRRKELFSKVRDHLDTLGVERDENGWTAKTFLYCMEVRCPESGWMVPIIPALVISRSRRVILELRPNQDSRCYDLIVLSGVSEERLARAGNGTLGRDSKFGEGFVTHRVDGVSYKTKISTLRGDYQRPDGTVANQLRLWGAHDFRPQPNDLFQERLYAVHWMKEKDGSRKFDYEFRSVNDEDLNRERIVEDYVASHLEEWQRHGWLPDMRIEPGGPPRYEGLNLVRGRGWTHWHHLFNPRQLLVNGLISRFADDAALRLGVNQAANWNSKLSSWDGSLGVDTTHQTFYNQAINALYNYGARASTALKRPVGPDYKSFPIEEGRSQICCLPSTGLTGRFDMFISDPPYGDAVKYEEILDFFIAWQRKNPPPEFADWVWDSRRALAIQGEGEDFRRNMVSAYKRMTECMPDNGIQVIMFTHQSGSIWADMANIVWASGLQVTAAWYVVTETDSAMREGSHVKGTVLLIVRKRLGTLKTGRDDLAWDIQDEVKHQVETLTGLNQQARGLYRDENVFEDADLQMAGYAAALRVLTRYAIIDGRDMATEALRPRVKGEKTFVDELITFAVDTANRSLVPQGIPDAQWEKLSGAERFYLKMIDMEARGARTLDNYQNFAKAFKVRDFKPFMASHQANHACLKGAVEYGRSEMSEGSEFHQSTLRAVLYALMELLNNVDGTEVLAHLTLNVANYYGDMTRRELVIALADYLADKLGALRPDEASAARVLRELVKHQRLG